MDLIILGALAIFIFFKLRQQLGKVEEEQKREAIKKFIKERTNLVAEQLSEVANQKNKIDPESEKILNSLEPQTKEKFLEILQHFEISANFFIQGATKAFEISVESFAEADKKPEHLNTLKTILSEKVFKQFEDAIKQRINEKKDLISKIVSINSVTVADAKIMDNMSFVTVKFVSSQINYIQDENGNVIEGDKTLIADITDVWSFKKSLATKDNPNWVVSSTGVGN